MKFNTKLIHAGIHPDPSTGAIMTPIFQTSTYVQDAPGEHKGCVYGRTQNRTRDVLENNLAALENGKYALAFASGMAAMDAIIKAMKPGDEVIACDDLYGGSFRLLDKVYKRYGIVSNFIDMTDLDVLKAKINDRTKLIWIETPTNPMLKIFDISAISAIAKENEITVCVDNTFASPYLQLPLDLGADMVVHSSTKYLGGHSDVVQGAIITNDDQWYADLSFLQNAAGAVPGPQDCFLILRGIKTLHLRVQRSTDNAAKIAEYLQAHSKVSKVYYPGLESHPGHELAKRQMSGFGGMVSFDLHENTYTGAARVLSGTKLFSLAESLGGVESLIGHPASMTLASIPPEERVKVGLTDSLIRLSVGVEDVEDLINDLDKALL